MGIGDIWRSARNSLSICVAHVWNESILDNKRRKLLIPFSLQINYDLIYPTLVISFPCTCKKEIIKRLLSSDGSILSNSSSSLLSAFFPNIEQSNGAVLWTRHPPSGWNHVSFLRFPSKRCSFSFNRNRFFSSRFRCENSYWVLCVCVCVCNQIEEERKRDKKEKESR